jgi:hypothetical protein
MNALTKLHTTVAKAYKINPDIKFEVFIHKVDGLSDEAITNRLQNSFKIKDNNLYGSSYY